MGQAVSLQLLGAVEGDGLSEFDINANPLRDAFPIPAVHQGVVDLSTEPGFGFAPDFALIDRYKAPF
jgi:hypothetical protein